MVDIFKVFINFICVLIFSCFLFVLWNIFIENVIVCVNLLYCGVIKKYKYKLFVFFGVGVEVFYIVCLFLLK